jgi:hypothetical protein
MPTTCRAPPGAVLGKVEAMLAEDAAKGIELTKIDIHLVIALLRFAMAHGCGTVGDLAVPKVVGR